MAGADVIGTAVCIILLVVMCYVVVGSIMMTTGVIIIAQNDMTRSQQERMDTSITMADCRCTSESASLYRINFTVLNNGNNVIKNVNQTSVMIMNGSDLPRYYQNGLNTGAAASSTRTWYYDGSFYNDTNKASDKFNPGQWDPNEYLFGQVWIGFIPSTSTQLQIVLPNGMTEMSINRIVPG